MKKRNCWKWNPPKQVGFGLVLMFGALIQGGWWAVWTVHPFGVFFLITTSWSDIKKYCNLNVNKYQLLFRVALKWPVLFSTSPTFAPMPHNSPVAHLARNTSPRLTSRPIPMCSHNSTNGGLPWDDDKPTKHGTTRTPTDPYDMVAGLSMVYSFSLEETNLPSIYRKRDKFQPFMHGADG